MWLCKGSGVTSDSEIQYPSPPWRQGQEDIHPTETKYVGWSSYGTSGAVAGLSPPESREPEAGWAVRGGGSDDKIWRRTAISESDAANLAYSWGEIGVSV